MMLCDAALVSAASHQEQSHFRRKTGKGRIEDDPACGKHTKETNGSIATIVYYMDILRNR